MNPTLEPVETLSSWLADPGEEQVLAEPAWLTRLKKEALTRLQREPAPGPRQEGWRYSSPRTLLEQGFQPVAETVALPGAYELDEDELNNFQIPGMDAWRVVLVNGRFMPALSRLEDLPSGVRVAGLQQVLAETPELLEGRLNRIAGAGAHLFAALNTAGMDDGCVIQVAENVCLERPLELLQLSLGAGQPRLIQPRHLVLLERGAQLTLVERYLSREPSLYCTNNLMEIDLREGARLSHYRVQEESPNAFHLAGLYLSQSADSRYSAGNLALGARWSRTDIRVAFQAPGAECEIDGLYLAGDGQLVDFHLDVEHAVPGCVSHEHFKGLLTGKGRAVLDARIHVAKQAQKTSAHLKNANLMLSRQAEVDTKPQLEIFADDVQCSHGASVGQLDAEALFYLRSRGIDESEARRMLCIGFAGEIIKRCGPAPLREYIETRVADRLS